MFFKEKEVGRGGYRVTKRVIDWDAVLGAVLLVLVAFAAIGAIAN